MIVKNTGTNRSTLSQFDLFGQDENALSKAFAFILSKDAECFFTFLRFIGIQKANTAANYKGATISIQYSRVEGRTDIELHHLNEYHVIIECKIGKGKVEKQRTQYLAAFEGNTRRKVLCLLTQERDTNKEVANDVVIRNISWLDILELYNNKKFSANPLIAEFLNFTTRNYKMKELKEILVQDISDKYSIERFLTNGIYRRSQTFGTPIYFAPYFNRPTGKEGIFHLSKILGILTLRPGEIENFRDDLHGFKTKEDQVAKWINGVKCGEDKEDSIFTYYFLDSPLVFSKPLLKDGGIKKGRGKDWIAAMIPRNRCVSFSEFIKHIPELIGQVN